MQSKTPVSDAAFSENRWTELGRTRTPDGDELTLYGAGDVYVIRCNGWELMSSRAPRSEQALARVGCGGGFSSERPTILVGGLGMGYTLRATLDLAPAAARIVVAELVPEVVEWNHGFLGALSGHPLSDPRVELYQGDVAHLIARAEATFDVVLCDVDNGPEAVIYQQNNFLYSARGLARMRHTLAPHGTLAVWSADRSPDFETGLHEAGFDWRAVEIAVGAAGSKVAHTIYVARRGELPRSARVEAREAQGQEQADWAPVVRPSGATMD